MNDPSSDEKFSVEQYHRDMAKILKGECVNRSRLGLARCNIDTSGIMFVLMIPAMFVWLVFKVLFAVKAPFYGWIRLRKIGMALTLLFTLVMFALLVFVGVQHDPGTRSNHFVWLLLIKGAAVYLARLVNAVVAGVLATSNGVFSRFIPDP